MGGTYVNLATVLEHMKRYDEVLPNYFKGIELCKQVGDRQAVGYAYLNVAQFYSFRKQFNQAFAIVDSTLAWCKASGDLIGERGAYETYSQIYSDKGDYKTSLSYYVKFKTFTDSIFNIENSKQMSDLKTQFEVEKKAHELQLKSEAQEALAAEEKKQQRIIIYAVIAVLMVVMIFSIFLYKRFRMTQKQKKVIEEQKILVDAAYAKLTAYITRSGYRKRSSHPSCTLPETWRG